MTGKVVRPAVYRARKKLRHCPLCQTVRTSPSAASQRKRRTRALRSAGPRAGDNFMVGDGPGAVQPSKQRRVHTSLHPMCKRKCDSWLCDTSRLKIGGWSVNVTARKVAAPRKRPKQAYGVFVRWRSVFGWTQRERPGTPVDRRCGGARREGKTGEDRLGGAQQRGPTNSDSKRELV